MKRTQFYFCFAGKQLCITVGMIALADCLGPYVLNGRTITMGRLKLR